jgi:hypothetical protein
VSQLQHPVQDMNGGSNFARPKPCCMDVSAGYAIPNPAVAVAIHVFKRLRAFARPGPSARCNIAQIVPYVPQPASL